MKINYPLFYLLIIAYFSAQTLYAQDKPAGNKLVLYGTVTDQKDGSPILGATVVEINKEKRIVSGVVTDHNGSFALTISDPNNTITISFIGYKSVSRPISVGKLMTIALEEDATTLDDIVVTAEKKENNGMMDISKRDLTSATASLNAKELEELGITSIDQALQGRLAGVDVVATSGDPGSGMSIRIRGTSSINQSSNPLIVVDGMPYEVDVSGFNFTTADEQGYAQLLNIAPSDIKDITVLKDAAATAIWGARASNGVLVINTKRGAKGNPTVTYTFKGVASKQPKSIPMLSGDEYSTLILEGYMNKNGKPLNTTTNKEFSYDISDPYYYYNYSNNTNWIDQITQLGTLYDHNISLSGGGEKTLYFASLGHTGQNGTTVGTDLNRINGRINLNYNISDRLRLKSDFAYTHVTTNAAYTKDLRAVAYKKMPNMSVYEYDEDGNNTSNYFSPASNIQGYFSPNSNRTKFGTYNPVAMARASKNVNIGERIRPVFNLQYDVLPEVLIASFDVAFDINNNNTNRFLPQIATGLIGTDSNINRSEEVESEQYNIQTKSSLLYTPIINENHKLQAYLSWMTYDDKSVGYTSGSSNAATSELQDPSIPARTGSADLTIASGTNQYRSVGAVLNVQYGLLDRYIFNVGVRRDGNSRFGSNYRFGSFPSASVRWRVSGESFMKQFTFINDLSLRASYGTSGNPPGKNYLYFGQYTTTSANYQGDAGIVPSTMELSNLKWESVVQQNYGINLLLYNGRFEVNGEYYRKRTNDLFYEDLLIPTSSGFSTIDMNSGVMDNIGWEINLSYTPIRQKDLTVRFDLNMARNFNIIREIPEYYANQSGSIVANGSYLSVLRENTPFGSFFGYRYKGVYRDSESTIAKDAIGNPIYDATGQAVQMRFNYPSTDYLFQAGDAIYEDINHDGNINYMDVVYLGNANPKLTGGFGPSVTYKNFKVNLFFSYRYNYDIINMTKYYTENMTVYDNQSTAVLRRWRNEGDVTNMPRAVIGTNFNSLGSDRFVEDGSFVRLKYVTVKYSFTKPFLEKLNLADLGIYFTAENLYTLTNYTGQDPEVSYSGTDPFKAGYDESYTPPARSYTVGLNVRF